MMQRPLIPGRACPAHESPGEPRLRRLWSSGEALEHLGRCGCEGNVTGLRRLWVPPCSPEHGHSCQPGPPELSLPSVLCWALGGSVLWKGQSPSIRSLEIPSQSSTEKFLFFLPIYKWW